MTDTLQLLSNAIASAGTANRLAGDRRAALHQRVQDLTVQIKASELEAKTDAEAADLLNAAAEGRREGVVRRVERVVTEALRAMLGSHVGFRLDLAVKRGVLAVDPRLVYRRGNQIQDVSLKEVGGGVIDVVAFAARVTVICLMRPRRCNTLVADEPFRHVSAEYLPHVANMVKRLSTVSKLQFIIVSHEPEIAAVADTLIRVAIDPKTGHSNFSGQTLP